MACDICAPLKEYIGDIYQRHERAVEYKPAASASPFRIVLAAIAKCIDWGGKGVRNRYLKCKLCTGIDVWEIIAPHVRKWSGSRAQSNERAW